MIQSLPDEQRCAFPAHSLSSIRRACKQERIVYASPKKQIALSSYDLDLRLRMCTDLIAQYRKHAEELRKNPLLRHPLIKRLSDMNVYTDECMLREQQEEEAELMSPGRKTLFTPKVSQAGKRGLMVWAAINKLEGLLCYHIYEVGESVNGVRYSKLIEKVYLPKAQEHYDRFKNLNCHVEYKRLIIVEDNCGAHYAHETEKVFEDNKEVLRGLAWRDAKAVEEINRCLQNNIATRLAFGWSPHSPDLNPIELLWRWLRAKLIKIAASAPLSVRQTQIKMLLESDECNTYCKALCNYFELMIAACVEKKGGMVPDSDLKENWKKICREEGLFNKNDVDFS